MLTRFITLVFLCLALQNTAPPVGGTHGSPAAADRTRAAIVETESKLHHKLALFDWVMLALAVGAFILAGVAIKYAKKQKQDAITTLGLTTSTLQELKETKSSLSPLRDQLSALASQLSTRYVGKFPDNLKDIIELLNLAQKSIVIIVDFAGYSSYTDPSAFRDYYYAIESSLRAKPDFSVRFYIYDSVQHQRLLQLAFPRAVYQEQMFKRPSIALLTQFMKRMEKRNIAITDYDSLIRALLDDEERCIGQFQELQGCECFELQRPVPIFLWMVDDRECIFAFENEQERVKNYFSFRTRDGSLIEYFLHYMREVMARTNQHPSHSVEDLSAMNLLVPELGHCTKVNGRLAPCNYHRDRLDVRHYQQKETSGERDIDEVTIELTPDPGILELLDLMDDKKMPAGDWGLMMSHRRWLVERIAKAVREKGEIEQDGPAVLQLGTAGPVHYFGTAKIIAEALTSAGMPTTKQVRLFTRDRCLTPVACVRYLLEKLQLPKDVLQAEQWATVDTEGIRKTLDPSFYSIGADRPPIGQMLQHHISLGDICHGDFLNGCPAVDIVIAHFTFSMWASTPTASCRQGYDNVARALKSGGTLLAALSEFHNTAVTSVDQYHKYLADAGLRLVSATRTWDVYDFSVTERQRLLYAKGPQLFRKRVILAEYNKP
jgi:hypothetical protein